MDLGRVGAGAALAPRYSVLTDTPANRTAYDANDLANARTPRRRTAARSVCNRFVASNSGTLFAKANAFLSIVDPTQPIVLVDATVLLQQALTFDEGGNFINVIFSRSRCGTGTPREHAGATLRANYHLGPTDTIARNNGRALNNSRVPPIDARREPGADRGYRQ